MDTQLIINQASLAFGLAGTILGIISTVRLMAMDRVRLRVYVSGACDGQLAGTPFAITVVNLSPSPVTITTVGFTECGFRNRFWYFHPVIAGEPDGKFPYRLEPRTSIAVIMADPASLEDQVLATLQKPIAFTACGLHFTGSAKWLRDYKKLKIARSAAPGTDDGLDPF